MQFPAGEDTRPPTVQTEVRTQAWPLTAAIGSRKDPRPSMSYARRWGHFGFGNSCEEEGLPFAGAESWDTCLGRPVCVRVLALADKIPHTFFSTFGYMQACIFNNVI